MIIPATPTDDRYGGGDPYAAADQYGSSGLNGSRYGDQYGTGSYSDYSTSRGRYSTGVEIAGYDIGESGTGYGYVAGGTDDRYSAATSSGGMYGYLPGDTMHSYEDVVFEYVIDVLDGNVEI